MKHEIIYTEHYALIVSDERPLYGECYFNEFIIAFRTGRDNSEYVEDSIKKIIAHKPLTDAPILKGVPLLPEFSEEDSIKDYSLDAAKEFALNHFNGLKPKYGKGGYITIKSILDVLKIGVECGHKFGLKQAKETYKYTEDDLRKAICFGMYGEYGKEKTTIGFIQSLQQPKRPKYFDCEIEYIHDVTVPYPKTLGTKPKTITNSQGQTELIGTYFYE